MRYGRSRGGGGREGAATAVSSGSESVSAVGASALSAVAVTPIELETPSLEAAIAQVASLSAERSRLLGEIACRDRAAAAAASQHARLTRQLEGGFTHMMRAHVVFEIPDFLSVNSLVCESQVFSAGGLEWRLWVKPFSGPTDSHVGLYLVPAEDLPHLYTADFTLAIVGRQGHLLERELTGGRAKLQGCRAGHGWPTFIERSALASNEGGKDIATGDPGDSSMLLHGDGRLIVTCSGLANVRHREATADLARTM